MELHAQVKVNVYRVLDDAVERGIRYGYLRAHKHVDNPTEEQVVDAVHRAVMNELCELLKFDEET